MRTIKRKKKVKLPTPKKSFARTSFSKVILESFGLEKGTP
mgnify:CR=1 FL=1